MHPTPAVHVKIGTVLSVPPREFNQEVISQEVISQEVINQEIISQVISHRASGSKWSEK
jgi:hypothetical protein